MDINDYYDALSVGYPGTYEDFLAENNGGAGTDYGIPSGQQSQADTSNNNFWDAATAVLDVAGNVIKVLDKDGNEIDPNTIDAVHVAPKDNTIYYILAAVIAAIAILLLFIMLKKK